MSYSDLKWPAVIMSSALAAAYLVAADVVQPVRAMVLFWFLLVCPGMAFVRLLRLTNPVHEWLLAIFLSLCLDLLVAEILIYAGVWSARNTLMILGLLCACGVLCQLTPWFRSARSPAPEH
jgi:hypothetical protein